MHRRTKRKRETLPSFIGHHVHTARFLWSVGGKVSTVDDKGRIPEKSGRGGGSILKKQFGLLKKKTSRHDKKACGNRFRLQTVVPTRFILEFLLFFLVSPV